MRTRARLAALLLAGCAAESEPSEVAAAAASNASIVWSSSLPFSNVSGLAVRTSGSSAPALLAVGDERTTLVTIEVPPEGRPRAPVRHDLSAVLGEGESQFEAVAADGRGRVFLLVESRSEIAVLAPGLDRLVGRVTLRFPSGHPLANAWSADPNSRGEGMVLLTNGHVLVAKEKKPAAIVEFAPAGSPPEGYRPELSPGEGPFPLPADAELVASAYWCFDHDDERRLGDIAELALDAGRILLLSDQSRAMAFVGASLDPASRTIPVEAIHRLPSAIAKPEGLVVLGGRTFVASDERDASRNALFELESWSAPRSRDRAMSGER